MRTIQLLALVSLLATTYARPNRQNRDHREIMDNQARNGPSPSEAQWLTFDDTPSTASMPAYTPLATASPLVKKPPVKGYGCKANQAQAVNYIQKQMDPPLQSQSGGTVPQEEVDEWLRVHDIARSQHGAGRLRWNETLAIGAKSNAIQCRGQHTSVHLHFSDWILIEIVLSMERIYTPTLFSSHPRKLLMLGWLMLVSSSFFGNAQADGQSITMGSSRVSVPPTYKNED
jgi:hypothetical protein